MGPDDVVADLSTELLGAAQPQEVGAAIRVGLETLCRALDVERGYVVKVAANDGAIEVSEEWWAAGIDQGDHPDP